MTHPCTVPEGAQAPGALAPAPRALVDAPRHLPQRARVVDSDGLLGPRGELFIQHAGHLYRLRVTAQGKLILTK